jgi:hypothetical protein
MRPVRSGGAKEAPKNRDYIMPLKPSNPDEPVWTVRRRPDRAFDAVGVEVSGQVTVEVRGEVTGEVGPGQTQSQSRGQGHWSNGRQLKKFMQLTIF